MKRRNGSSDWMLRVTDASRVDRGTFTEAYRDRCRADDQLRALCWLLLRPWPEQLHGWLEERLHDLRSGPLTAGHCQRINELLDLVEKGEHGRVLINRLEEE